MSGYFDTREDRCRCSGDTYWEPGSICTYCEQRMEQEEADEKALLIAEAHLRDPEPEDFQEAPPC